MSLASRIITNRHELGSATETGGVYSVQQPCAGTGSEEWAEHGADFGTGGVGVGDLALSVRFPTVMDFLKRAFLSITICIPCFFVILSY
jgi:hypothetical protein